MDTTAEQIMKSPGRQCMLSFLQHSPTASVSPKTDSSSSGLYLFSTVSIRKLLNSTEGNDFTERSTPSCWNVRT